MQDRQPPLGVFVGRSAELGRVAEVIALVEAGQPWLVTIEGEPGVGKTALARRCLAGPAAAGLRVLPARADQAEADLDFGLVDQLLRAAGRASRLAGPAGGNGPAVSSFAVGAQLLDVVGVQLAAGSTVIFLDDLQWADRKSVEALTFMLRRLSVDPVLAVVTYRGPGSAWTGRPSGCCRAWRTGCMSRLGALAQMRWRRWPARSGQGRWMTRWSGGCTRTPAVIRCTCRRC